MLRHKDEIVSNAFGLWISALFSDIAGYNPELSFAEQKLAFFELLQELLDSGKVRFVTPNEFWSEGNDIWNADNSEILSYLLQKWPNNAESERDLSDYFYEIPAIIWVDENGNLHGS